MKKALALVLVVVLSFGALSVFAVVDDTNKGSTTTATAPGNISIGEPSEVKLASSGKLYVDIAVYDGAAPADLTNYQLYQRSGSNLDSIKFRAAYTALGQSNYKGTVSTSDSDKGKGNNVFKYNADGKKAVEADGKTVNTDGYYLPDNIVRVYWSSYKGTSYAAEVTLKATFTLKNNAGARSEKYEIEVKYDPETLLLELLGDNQASFTALKGKIYKMDEAGSLSEVQFEGESGRVIELSTGRISKNTKFNLTYTTTLPSALEESYIDKSLEYFAITGSTAALGSWKLTFDSIDTTTYLYGYASGELYNLTDGSWGWKRTGSIITVTGSGAIPAIVLSSTDLKITSTGTATTSSAPTTTTNPNTGSADMVSVAVAMAVVSLAAAGAVAFKKASK